MEKLTGQMRNYDGIPIFVPNDTFNLEDSGCYISYNNHTSDYGCPTTALVRDDGVRPTKFLILNGNHVEEYAKLKTYNACVEYFKAHLEQQNHLSENWDEELVFDDKLGLHAVKIAENNHNERESDEVER